MVQHTIPAKTSAQVTWTLDLLASLAVCEDLCALARADIFDCKCLWICVMLIKNTYKKKPQKRRKYLKVFEQYYITAGVELEVNLQENWLNGNILD